MTDQHDEKEAAGRDYEQMLLLEDLESLAEEMDEIGVRDSAEVRRWLAQSHGAPGVPVADEAALKSILDLMQELGVADRATLANQIRSLREEMDWE